MRCHRGRRFGAGGRARCLGEHRVFPDHTGNRYPGDPDAQERRSNRVQRQCLSANGYTEFRAASLSKIVNAGPFAGLS